MASQIPTVAVHPTGNVPSPKSASQGRPASDKQQMTGDRFVHAEELKTGAYDATGKVHAAAPANKNLLDRFLALQQSVEQQLLNLYNSFNGDEENAELVEGAKEDLHAYFSENPQALEEVANGQVPEYWNVENTAKRMFDIVTAGVADETDRQAFYEKAVDFVNKAYDDVKLVLGFEFPPLVKDTREALMNGLEQFKDGTDLKQIVFQSE